MSDTPPPAPRPEPSPGDSIIDSIARRTGRAPRLNLSEEGGDDSAPLIDPKARTFQDELSASDQGKYRILGEIARGGMGVVLRGHDIELGREVAIKVADAELAKRPEVVERFVEEAQIGGQLQHPGIVPVYELGLMSDERPFFTMKLVKGRTLAAMLARRKSLDEDRVRFLSLFESVCQTMAYAHSKGVIHRDLKPANIMVGAFGEVQVVDWGLSKVLRRGGVADEVEARDTALSVIATVRSGPGSGSDSIVGNVLGTPAYMSPEQAQGEIGKLDERTDVFALGAILCEILTGSPPYIAAEGVNVVQKAALAELDDARERIAATSAADDLKKLCLASLLPSRAARPRDAEEVASAVHEHLAGLEERAHEERLKAERSRRQTQLVVFAGLFLVLAVGGGGGGWWWTDKRRRERETELTRAFEEISTEVLQFERAGEFERALESAQGALRLVDSGTASDELRGRADALLDSTDERWRKEQERLAAAAAERQLFTFFDEAEMNYGLDTNTTTSQEVNGNYRAALREFGIDLEAPDVEDSLALYRDTPFGIRLALGFDGWARILRRKSTTSGVEFGVVEDDHDIALLTGIGLDLDPDPVRRATREALVAGDAALILDMARPENVAQAAPASLLLLAGALSELNEYLACLRVSASAAERFPDNFYVLAQASLLHAQDVLGRDRAIAYARAAVALKPDYPGGYDYLIRALDAVGDAVEVTRVANEAMARFPGYRWDLRLVGVNWFKAGHWDRAIACFDRALEQEPGHISNLDLAKLARVMAGQLSRAEYFSWIGGTVDVSRWPRALFAFTVFLPPGVDPEPERAIRILEPTPDWEYPDYCLPLGTAYAAVGNGKGAIRAARELEQRAYGDRFYRCLAHLVRSAGHALEGDQAEAAEYLERARSLRRMLYLGREADWAGGPIDMAFEQLEPIALGR